MVPINLTKVELNIDKSIFFTDLHLFVPWDNIRKEQVFNRYLTFYLLVTCCPQSLFLLKLQSQSIKFFEDKTVCVASCCAMPILCRKNIGELQLYFYFTHYRPFPSFSFCLFVILTVLFLFLGASIVCFNNLKRTSDLVL